MKNLLHICPPSSFRAVVNRSLQWHLSILPFLCFRIGGHFSHTRSKIVPGIFHISKQKSVFAIDGIVADVVGFDHFQYFMPYCCMIFLVFLKILRLNSNNLSETFILYLILRGLMLLV